ncbi:FadR/GntR family transcriptional regulator [Rhodococcoides fascians]|uniref:FadR/GntR family transcriptional regulator n=1 Tax=Rhodococcoides fascians TaxID=1828 RepID=UPI00050CD5D3|nr:FCD domain-containing protein [Rhodococcus fascians]
MFTSPQTRAQSLVHDIERLIVDRGLHPGERIDTMDGLREQTGLGRATISEAARLLAERGTVDIRPGRGGGLFVAEVGPVVRLRHTLLAVDNEGATVADAIAVRDSLEELIDVDAALHRTTHDIADLNQIIGRMRAEAVTRDAFMRVNWLLHERIAQITPNQMARGVYLGTLKYVSGLASHADSAIDVDERAYTSHRVDVHADLVAAITAGDRDETVRVVHLHRGLRSS